MAHKASRNCELPTVGEEIEYRDKTVGQLKNVRGLAVFDWYQNEFRILSDEETQTFAMGHGLLEQLEEYDVDMICVNQQYIPIDSVTKYRNLQPDNELFNSPPPEPQWAIEVCFD